MAVNVSRAVAHLQGVVLRPEIRRKPASCQGASTLRPETKLRTKGHKQAEQCCKPIILLIKSHSKLRITPLSDIPAQQAPPNLPPNYYGLVSPTNKVAVGSSLGGTIFHSHW